MPRPKPATPLVQFHAKLPPSEAAALAKIVPLWADDLAARLAEQGIHTPPPADRTAWLRAVIREHAARYKVSIDDTPAPDAPRRTKRAEK